VLIRRRDVRLREKKIDLYKYPAIDKADEEEKGEKKGKTEREKKGRKEEKNRGDDIRISIIESFLLPNQSRVIESLLTS
jgi:hypothetical protein